LGERGEVVGKKHDSGDERWCTSLFTGPSEGGAEVGPNSEAKTNKEGQRGSLEILHHEHVSANGTARSKAFDMWLGKRTGGKALWGGGGGA